jgi:hypothetical protein
MMLLSTQGMLQVSITIEASTGVASAIEATSLVAIHALYRPRGSSRHTSNPPRADWARVIEPP